ncbi:uncharacterized protein LOC107631337 isoform X5 [Arachis ipaensis]|uniref:uncharacterized protein LOC107631337 isoform X5 n=1 Tax=Arachis ipaensis TaxID=130454 RepID=UPI000A2B4830|nr:uncharacterized protein LOC107631337 isoform X5 [Arachis ipaensis]
MKKLTAIVSIFVILTFSFHEIAYVSSSPLLHHAKQVHEEKSSTVRNLEQDQEHAGEVHCSRERSRAARKVIEQSHDNCLADLCGALHCDAVMNSKFSRTKCYPAAAAKNRHLYFVQSLADSCFSISQGPSASRLHELFIHQFCDAHTCSGKQKPFSRGGKEQSSFFRLAAGALILVLLPVFYLFLYLVQSCSDMKGRTQELRRISKAGWKVKPS